MAQRALTWLFAALLTAASVTEGRAYEETENTCVVATIPQHLVRALSAVAAKLKKYFPPPPPLDMTGVTDGVDELAKKMDEFRLKIVKSISTSINASTDAEAEIVNVTQSRSEEVASIILNESLKTKQYLQNLSNLSTVVAELYKDIGDLEVENAELINGIVNFLDNESVVSEEPEDDNLPVAALMDLLSLQQTQQDRLGAVLQSMELQEQEKTPLNVNNMAREIQESEKTMQDRRRRLLQENENIEKVLQNGIDVSMRPRDCWDLFSDGKTESGVYTVFPERCGPADAAGSGVRVWCDMGLVPGGGGWTVLLSRDKKVNSRNHSRAALAETTVESDVLRVNLSSLNDGGIGDPQNGNHAQENGLNGQEPYASFSQNETLSLNFSSQWENFTRNWADYEAGFGRRDGEYFLGLRNTHVLTRGRRYCLLMVVQGKGGRQAWGKWGRFRVAGKTLRYTLQVGQYSALSSVPDVLASHNRQRFSTFDDDNDASYSSNCAELYGGGWWYRRCYDANPTGVWEEGDPSTRGVVLGRTMRDETKNNASDTAGNRTKRTAAVGEIGRRRTVKMKLLHNKRKQDDDWEKLIPVMNAFGREHRGRQRNSESSNRSRKKRSSMSRLAPVAQLKLLIRPAIADKWDDRQDGIHETL